MQGVKLMNKKKLSILTAVAVMLLCAFVETANAAPSKILTFTNMPSWDYHKTNYDKYGNVRINTGKTTFNLRGEEKPNYIPMFNIEEAKVGEIITIVCKLKTDEQKGWFKNINKLTKEDSLKNPNLEEKLEFEKEGSNLVIKENQKVLDNNGLYNIKVYSKNYDPVTIQVNIVQAEPIKVLVSYPMNPRNGEDVRFKLESFNYAITNPVKKVFLTHNNNRKELVKFEDYHVISDLLTVYAKDKENGEGNLLEPGRYTIEIYADGFKRAEKKFEVIKNEVKATGKNVIEKKSKVKPLILKGSSSKLSSIDTLSGASVGVIKGSDNSGSKESSGAGIIMQTNLVYNHDLLVNALILKELGMGTTDSDDIADRFELNTISYDAAISEDGTHINEFRDYLNSVKDAALEGEYLRYDEYIRNKNAKSYINRPYNVKEVLEDNLLGEAKSFREILGLKSPNLEIKTSVMYNDMVLQCEDNNYLNSIKSISINGNMREINKDLYSVIGNKLIINNKIITGDAVQLKILATGYKDKVVKVKLEKVLDKIDLKMEKRYETHENVVVTGLTNDFIKNIKCIKLDGDPLLTREQGGYSSSTYYAIEGNKLILQQGLFKEARDYKLEIDAKYYGKKELPFTIAKREGKITVEKEDEVQEKKELPNMRLKVDSKPGFMKKYDIKFGNSGDWINNIIKVFVNGIEYKSGLLWGKTSEYYSIYSVDEIIGIGSDKFKANNDNVVVVKAKGYDDFTFIITKDGKISFN